MTERPAADSTDAATAPVQPEPMIKTSVSMTCGESCVEDGGNCRNENGNPGPKLWSIGVFGYDRI